MWDEKTVLVRSRGLEKEEGFLYAKKINQCFAKTPFKANLKYFNNIHVLKMHLPLAV